MIPGYQCFQALKEHNDKIMRFARQMSYFSVLGQRRQFFWLAFSPSNYCQIFQCFQALNVMLAKIDDRQHPASWLFTKKRDKKRRQKKSKYF